MVQPFAPAWYRPNKVDLKFTGHKQEYVAGGTITPGHLIMYNSSGQVVVHNVYGGATETMFAFTHDFEGYPVGVWDNYVSGERVAAGIFKRGDEVLAILTPGFKANQGNRMISAGDGTLRAQGGTPTTTTTTPAAGQSIPPDTPLAIALETVDFSTTSTTTTTPAPGQTLYNQAAPQNAIKVRIL